MGGISWPAEWCACVWCLVSVVRVLEHAFRSACIAYALARMDAPCAVFSWSHALPRERVSWEATDFEALLRRSRRRALTTSAWRPRRREPASSARRQAPRRHPGREARRRSRCWSVRWIAPSSSSRSAAWRPLRQCRRTGVRPHGRADSCGWRLASASCGLGIAQSTWPRSAVARAKSHGLTAVVAFGSLAARRGRDDVGA